MILISSILKGQDLETSLTQAKIAYKNRQITYQLLKKGVLKGRVPEKRQQKEKFIFEPTKHSKTED